jgi:hypothetical protein
MGSLIQSFPKAFQVSARNNHCQALILAMGAGSIGYALSHGLLGHGTLQASYPGCLKDIGDLSYSLILSYVFTLGLCKKYLPGMSKR